MNQSFTIAAPDAADLAVGAAAGGMAGHARGHSAQEICDARR